MKKTCLFLLLMIICLLLIGCQSNEDKATKLVSQANVFFEAEDFESAMSKYEEANNLFPTEKYKQQIQSLRACLIFFRSNETKANLTMFKVFSSLRSQFFQSLRHLSSHPKVLSTTHLLGITAKVCNSERLAT